MNRRDFCKLSIGTVLAGATQRVTGIDTTTSRSKVMKSKVFFIRDITSENLIKIYSALGIELPGKVGVKVSTGERGSRGYLKADLIGPLVKATFNFQTQRCFKLSNCVAFCKGVK